jgi:plasmid stabilization system protein ParE
MASKPVRFHSEAEQEYLESLSWYRNRSILAAANFEDAITKAVHAIQNNPRMWPAYFGPFQKYTLRQFPFSLVFEEHLTEVLVIAVAHGSRRPGYWKNRV